MKIKIGSFLLHIGYWLRGWIIILLTNKGVLYSPSIEAIGGDIKNYKGRPDGISIAWNLKEKTSGS